MAAHSAAISSGLSPPAPCSARAAPHSAAMSISSSAIFARLLQQEFFEEDLIHLGRENSLVDAAQELFLQSVHAGRTVEVLGPHFAQMRLETVDDARQERADLLGLLFVGDFQRDLDLQIF